MTSCGPFTAKLVPVSTPSARWFASPSSHQEAESIHLPLNLGWICSQLQLTGCVKGGTVHRSLWDSVSLSQNHAIMMVTSPG